METVSTPVRFRSSVLQGPLALLQPCPLMTSHSVHLQPPHRHCREAPMLGPFCALMRPLRVCVQCLHRNAHVQCTAVFLHCNGLSRVIRLPFLVLVSPLYVFTKDRGRAWSQIPLQKASAYTRLLIHHFRARPVRANALHMRNCRRFSKF